MPDAIERNPWIAYAKLVALPFCWGSTMIAGRVVAAQIPTLTAGAIRLIIASILLLVLLRRESPFPKLSWSQFRTLAVMGICGVFIFNFFFFLALQKIPGSKGALIVALIPVLTALAVSIVLRERLGLGRWVGICLAFLGVTIVVTKGDWQQAWHYLGNIMNSGEGLMLIAAIGWVVYTVLSRFALRGLSPLAASTYAAVVGTICLCLGALSEFQQWPSMTWSTGAVTGLVYVAVMGTVIPYIWFVQGVQRFGPTRTAVYINLTPVFGVSLGFLVLGEPIHLSMIVGGLIVIAGVMLTNLSKT